MTTYSNTMKHIREKHGDSLEDLSEKVKVSVEELAEIENGESTPSLKLIRDFAVVYNESLSHFIGEDPDETDEENSKYEKWLPFINQMEQKGVSPEYLIELLQQAGQAGDTQDKE
ncbi:helix-turn-helix domain-containing protein [Pontibacillus salicampi]|uniref:Helix-turn-helix domain-containing protein n=1 Tax=Pontibacillus salicampi TaxID=1449801 RepID=A0ABV6LLL4_9BACI